MLLSPRLIGMRLHNDQLYPGKFEPIITTEEYEDVKGLFVMKRGGAHCRR